MIKELSVKSFQSHKDSVLEFDPGVNVIVGESDSGKTALLRALRWILVNKPGGDAFRSNFGGDTEVKLTTEEGNVITRAKNKENLYWLNDTRFAAFGTEVPQEIVEAINIDAIGFSRQFDMPFLLNDSSGEVATHFNKLAHLEKIDLATKKVQSAIRDLEQDIKSETKQLSNEETELEKYAYLDKMEIELEVLEGLEKELEQVLKRQSKLNTFLSALSKVQAEIEENQVWVEMETDLDKILSDYEERESITNDRNSLNLILNKIVGIENTIKKQTAVIALESFLDKVLGNVEEKERLEKEVQTLTALNSKIQNIETETESLRALLELSVLITPILTLYGNEEDLTTKIKELNSYISKIKVVEGKIKTKEQNLKENEDLFVLEMGETCILCGQTIKTK